MSPSDTIADCAVHHGRYPDRTCTDAERRTIADQRAEAVRAMLLMGVSPVLMTASGYSNSQYLDIRVEVVVHPLTSA